MKTDLTIKPASYAATVAARFQEYRSSQFAGKDYLFEERPPGGAIVFRMEYRSENILIPPFANEQQRRGIIASIALAQRHQHFGSMRSSQALAQSVFAAIGVMQRTPLLAGVKAECGQPAFGHDLSSSFIALERSASSLGEPRPTSVDVWLESPDPVAVECKFSERDFGTCSRPRLRPTDSSFQAQHCDGTYTRQRGRAAPCALTEIGVRYWQHAEALFGWPREVEHRPCPMASTYQLVRNVLAASVSKDGRLSLDRGHALILYDARNPAMGSGGEGQRQWQLAISALAAKGKLRRLSWQSLIAQWPNDDLLLWLRGALSAKYGLTSATPVL